MGQRSLACHLRRNIFLSKFELWDRSGMFCNAVVERNPNFCTWHARLTFYFEHHSLLPFVLTRCKSTSAGERRKKWFTGIQKYKTKESPWEYFLFLLVSLRMILRSNVLRKMILWPKNISFPHKDKRKKSSDIWLIIREKNVVVAKLTWAHWVTRKASSTSSSFSSLWSICFASTFFHAVSDWMMDMSCSQRKKEIKRNSQGCNNFESEPLLFLFGEQKETFTMMKHFFLTIQNAEPHLWRN